MPSIGHLIILLVIIVLIFGTGKLTRAMGDIGRGVKEFKKGVADEEGKSTPVVVAEPAEPPVAQLAAPAKRKAAPKTTTAARKSSTKKA